MENIEIYTILAFCLSAVLLFIIFHLRPLKEKEISSLANKRRGKSIKKYFCFDKREYNPDYSFKKRMAPKGKFYEVQERLYEFPSTASALLKYKKHEWVIIAFEKEQKVNKVWVNKGIDHTQVSFFLSIDDVAEIALKDKCRSVFIFHNHPNGNPNEYNCTNPSNADIETAQKWSNHLNQKGINLLEFICERGRHYQFFQKCALDFKPILSFSKIINEQNGMSKLKNLTLHLERIF